MIKNIILDLGGVILDVDYNRAVTAFRETGIPDFEKIYSQKKQDLLFDRFERGEIPAAGFRDIIREMKPSLTDQEIDAAWNSMIIDTPRERFDFLRTLGKSYHLFLLSNTNEIHIKSFIRYYDETYGKNNFNSLFRNMYLSSQLGMRKPEPEIFNFVISQNNLDLEETLFVDDSQQHVQGALEAGMHALLLPKGEKIESWLLDELAKKK